MGKRTNEGGNIMSSKYEILLQGSYDTPNGIEMTCSDDSFEFYVNHRLEKIGVPSLFRSVDINIEFTNSISSKILLEKTMEPTPCCLFGCVS